MDTGHWSQREATNRDSQLYAKDVAHIVWRIENKRASWSRGWAPSFVVGSPHHQKTGDRVARPSWRTCAYLSQVMLCRFQQVGISTPSSPISTKRVQRSSKQADPRNRQGPSLHKDDTESTTPEFSQTANALFQRSEATAQIGA